MLDTWKRGQESSESLHTEERAKQRAVLSSFFISPGLEIAEADLGYSETSLVIMSADFEMLHATQSLGQHVPAASLLPL